MFNFTPLLGAQSASPASQSLLEFDGGVKVLVDVGWDESFDVEKLREIERLVPTLSFILLTHATTAHLGAFAHCCKHLPLFTRVPVYATIPVASLGRTLLQDLYSSTPLASSIIPADTLTESAYSLPSSKDGDIANILMQAPTPDEIANYFGLINSLKYSQPHQPLPSPFSPPLNGLTITAYSAGHTLGGTIWHIQHGMESVVYAVDWNQAREHVLSGAAWLGGPGIGGAEVLEQLRRPTALICSTKGSGQVTIAGQRNKRDDALLDLIRETVQNGGSVLVPSDSSARILELAYLLEETWASETSKAEGTSPLKDVRVYLASRTGGATMRYARSMLEWMEEGIVKEFEIASGAQEAHEQRRSRGQQGGGAKAEEDKSARAPFDFRHITLLERKSQVNKVLSGDSPCVMLASDTTLEWGFSKDAIKNMASDPRNLVILTERVSERNSQSKGLGCYLWELWNEANGLAAQDASSASVIEASGNYATLSSVRIAALEGNELSVYQQYLARQRQLHTTMQGDSGTMLETSADVLDDRSSSTSTTSEDPDEVNQGKVLNTATTLQHTRTKVGLTDAELGINILLRRKNIYDYEVRGKKGREKYFPYAAKRRRADDFGDLIRPEEYVRADEEDQIAGEALRDNESKKENAVGQKRRWDDAVRAVDGGKRIPNSAAKRRKADGTGASGAGAGAGDADSSDSEGEDEDDKVEGPAKAIIGTETIQLNCRISYVDFAGLHDGRTIQMLVPLIKPRKLILVAGDEDETKELAEECRKVLNSGSESGIDVYTPSIGMVIDASVDTNAWSVKLSRSMVRKLHWQNVRGLGVVAITGRLEAASLESPPAGEDGGAKKKAKLEAANAKDPGEEKMDTTPILDVVPATAATAARSVAQPFHVGDLRLADLRKIMQASGMTAEFRGEGILVINGTVAVKKTATGKIEVDGGAYSFADPKNTETGTFFKVKKKIYEGLAVVAGG
ncbi:cleavage and polyadenylation specificity factor subunit 2 [Lophiostoma macrostomum CBS 122681]|uniref:Cleavage and polyadenylation specificity factor subunit 2 n=1 Tax=Lophiostoma macrostomum CBS 122681 TaxID=1314788 RepID=A0A6A6TRZ3_9PLEO|nr:cleavage and polyadenylation specificity factor subunit 2 [Lophiostoma macrostomum CBS 122681]